MPLSPDQDAAVSAYCPEAAVHREPALALINQRSPPLGDPLQPFPLPAAAPFALPTPDDTQSALCSLEFAASVLPDPSLPTPPILKFAHNLRLPSFQSLGIAAPHPDRYPLYSHSSFSSLGAGPLSNPDDPLHALSPPLGRHHQLDGTDETSEPSPAVAKAHVEQLVPVVTPPSEAGMLNWGAFVNVRTAGVGSPPSSDPGVSPSLTTTANTSATHIVPMMVDMSDTYPRAAWIEEVKEVITSDFSSQQPSSVKVLSHALPCPSLTGHLFGQLIAAIHEETTSSTAWINVFHAVPGRFTLSDLPKSPPSTPGPAVGGDEYFTSKVFDSAVAVPDYQLESKLLPPSPRPVVAPGSVNISVVERYIPPTNTVEFAEMFTIRGHSLLYDRLIELSSDNGLLLFIYPTKTGARTFMKDYLGPVLDPLLRSITVVHELSADLGKSLGQMSSVERFIEYPSLRSEIKRFCEQLSEPSTSLQSTGEKKPTYSLLHAAKEEIVLSRAAWTDWWIKQEKPRVREVVTVNFRKAKKLSIETELTPSNLIQEVLDGVANREYDASGPTKGVEVGVFIIKKSS
ncbi:hypothetical protein K505DRAFT_248630 [Melanomma pulvis-pyrius CBS 109.77]|uniref:Uncharacterized protein n=1 Tax=Melanomma pulvis-pyrius CBS 109.77 TaxID=1314802 RepID=A0A6A6X4Y4_9PLEO|nr:hypothetical protein K505DRAFT_248630 [Melanomma pulvis-pyrius CBS 109.77]